VTNIIESSVNSTPGIEHIQSTSSPGVSVIAITFNLEKKIARQSWWWYFKSHKRRMDEIEEIYQRLLHLTDKQEEEEEKED
jgi:multidrug efflux pump subunit AcrB